MKILAAIGYALTLASTPAEPSPVLSPTPWLSGGSLYRGEVHVGVRPAVTITNDGPEWGVGVTLQITLFTPW